MDDQQLDTFFREKTEGYETTALREEGLEKLKNRLAYTHMNPPSSIIYSWIYPAAVVGLLLMNTLLLYLLYLQQAEKKQDQQEWVHASSGQPNLITVIDTIYRVDTLYVINETVYKASSTFATNKANELESTITTNSTTNQPFLSEERLGMYKAPRTFVDSIKHNSDEEPLASHRKALKGNKRPSNDEHSTLTDNHLPISESDSSLNNDLAQNEDMLAISDKEDLSIAGHLNSSRDTIQHKDSVSNSSSISNHRTDTTEVQKKIVNPPRPWFPDVNVFSGIYGGINVLTNSIAELESSVGTQFGITADIQLFKPFSIGTGLMYQRIGYNVDDLIESPLPISTSIQYPGISQDNIETLSEIDMQAALLDVPLSMRVLLPPHRKFTPYLGTGIILRHYLGQEFTYGFETVEGLRFQRAEDEHFSWKFSTWEALAGVHIPLDKKLMLRVEAFYQRDITPTSSEGLLFNIWGIRTGLLLRHKN